MEKRTDSFFGMFVITIVSFLVSIGLVLWIFWLVEIRIFEKDDVIDLWYYTSYFCYEDKNLRYYDMELDLVFEDIWMVGCEVHTRKRWWEMKIFVHESWSLEEIIEESRYSDRMFDRNNYDTWRYSIIE